MAQRDDVMREFIQTFKPKLTSERFIKGKQFSRWGAFEFIVRELLYNRTHRTDPITILETGTLNTTDDWLGYGQATLLWDWFINKVGGTGISVDIEESTCRFANRYVKNMHIVHSDSIKFLQLYPLAHKIDLLYLDSFNWSPELHVASSLHHIGELACIYDRLTPGCLIAVDDCHGEHEGKHVLVRDFFKNMLHQQPEYNGYVHVWRKK